MTAADEARAARAGAGLFHLPDRGLVEVSGADRERWLNGMVSNDVAALAPGPERSGCPALLLTRQGRIVADLHVLLRGERFWLETAGAAVAKLVAVLGRFIVADRVELRDASAEVDRLGLEGPAAARVLEAACGRPDDLAPDAAADLEIAGVPVVAAAFGVGGGPARQLFAPAGTGVKLAAALEAAGGPFGLVAGGPDALEILRIEAGTPRLGAELSEEVLPPEARLERAVSRRKGCYTGQEVVERLASQGRPSHLLVGFRFEAGPPGALPAEVRSAGRKLGEVTSACVSPAEGAIGLGYVRAAHAEPGTSVEVDGRPARVAALPFAAAAGAAAAG
jgi:aminomethyltransferase